MVSFFKNFGKGLLYVVLFPFLLVFIALYAVFGLLVFIFQLFKLVFLFFTGRTLFTDLEEDIAAKAILEGTTSSDKEETKTENSQLSLYPSDGSYYNSDYSSSFNNTDIEEEKEDDDHDAIY